MGEYMMGKYNNRLGKKPQPKGVGGRTSSFVLIIAILTITIISVLMLISQEWDIWRKFVYSLA